MKPGTIIKLPDGREGTVVYHGLNGYGIRWGRLIVDVEAILSQCPVMGEQPEDSEWTPQAMLRKPYPGAELECVGGDYEFVSVAERAAP